MYNVCLQRCNCNHININPCPILIIINEKYCLYILVSINICIKKIILFIRKLSAEESDSEFETSDVDENGFITWEEYIGDTFSSNHELENEVVIYNFIYFNNVPKNSLCLRQNYLC